MGIYTFSFFYLTVLIAASTFSALGVGGGVIYTPLQLFFGIGFHVAATTSLFLIMVTSFSATLVFRKAASVDWPLAIALESVTTLGAFLGGFYSQYVSASFLTYLFSGVLAVVAFLMLGNISRRSAMRSTAASPATIARTKRSGFFHWRRRMGAESYAVNLGVALPVAFVVGVVSGLVGISGGVLKVPMLVLLFGIPANIAVGSSAFMVGLTASGGFVGHVLAGHFDWKMALMLAPAVFIGAQLGARFSVKIDKGKIQNIFGYMLAALAVFLIVRTLL